MQIARPYYPEQRTYAPPASRSTMEPDLYSYRRPPPPQQQRASSSYRDYQSYDENPNTFLDRRVGKVDICYLNVPDLMLTDYS